MQHFGEEPFDLVQLDCSNGSLLSSRLITVYIGFETQTRLGPLASVFATHIAHP